MANVNINRDIRSVLSECWLLAVQIYQAQQTDDVNNKVHNQRRNCLCANTIRRCVMKFCQTDKILTRTCIFDDSEFL